MHTLSELISTFETLFPNLAKDVIYYYEGPNCIKIHPNIGIDMVFLYNNRLDYKLCTINCYRQELDNVLNLRKELSIAQTNFNNYKRSVKK